MLEKQQTINPTPRKKGSSTSGRTSEGKPNPIDVHVGNRIFQRRRLLALSQEKLAARLGLTFQQVQKYERGMNRIGASRLWDIAKVLDVSIQFFYDEIPAEIANQSPRFLVSAEDLAFADSVIAADPMTRQETYELVRGYYKIKNREVAKTIKELVILTAKTTFDDEEE